MSQALPTPCALEAPETKSSSTVAYILDDLLLNDGRGTRSELILYGQPVCKAEAPNPVLFREVLARLSSPLLGDEVLSPARFMAQIQERGQQGLFDELVLRTLLNWSRSSYEVGREDLAPLVGHGVSINLHPRSLFSPANVLVLLELSQIRPVLVELLETPDEFTSAELSRMQEVVAWLRSHRVFTALDDFGTGNSLRLLQLRPLVVKMAKDWLDSPSGMEMVRTLTYQLSASGVLVVLEGIETKEQLEWAHRFPELYAVQGYYLGRPAPLQQ